MTVERDDAPVDEVAPRRQRLRWVRYVIAAVFVVMVVNRLGPTLATYLGHGKEAIILSGDKRDNPLGGNAHRPVQELTGLVSGLD